MGKSQRGRVALVLLVAFVKDIVPKWPQGTGPALSGWVWTSLTLPGFCFLFPPVLPACDLQVMFGQRILCRYSTGGRKELRAGLAPFVWLFQGCSQWFFCCFWLFASSDASHVWIWCSTDQCWRAGRGCVSLWDALQVWDSTCSRCSHRELLEVGKSLPQSLSQLGEALTALLEESLQ